MAKIAAFLIEHSAASESLERLRMALEDHRAEMPTEVIEAFEDFEEAAGLKEKEEARLIK